MRTLLTAALIVPAAIVIFEVVPATSQEDDQRALERIIASQLGDREHQKRRLDRVQSRRLTRLRKLVEKVTEDYRRGEAGYDLLARAVDMLIEAEIELTEAPEKLIELRKRHIELRQAIGRVVEGAYQQGVASETDRMFADADAEGAIVQLEREKARSVGLAP